ncbi:MAG: hypothetical protein ACP5M4_15395 [Acidobacteriaceae bacterium]
MKSAAAFLIVSTMFVMAVLNGQMLNPDIDQAGQPFSYPACSVDQIGLQNAPMGTEITPAGYLYSGFGEMTFSIGYPAEPASQRIRTLAKGYLPIFHYTYLDGTVHYKITTFAASLPGSTGARNPVNFVRVVAENTGATVRTSYFTVSFPYTGVRSEQSPCNNVTHRFRRPVTPVKPGGYSQPGVTFNPHWTYGFQQDFAVRSGEVVYEFPTSPSPSLWLTEATRYNKPEQLHASPETPVLGVRYELHLKAGASVTLIFKMPVKPIAFSNSSQIQKLKSSDFNAALTETEALWEKRLNRGLQISLPEKEVTNTFKANLIFDMMSREHVGSDYIQTVNDLQYHAFWLRDGSHIMNTYDETGHLNLVRQSLPFFLQSQQQNGLFISQSGQYDGLGQALWTFGRYYQFSHDRAYAKSVFPAVLRAVQWLEQARKTDPLHILPAANPQDDEFDETAYVTGHNLWALAGLQEAIVLAKAVGTPSEVTEFQQEYNDYHETLFRLLDKIGAKNGEYIPPGIDIQGGQDWGNMNVLYPEMLVSPDNPLVAGTLRHVRKEYAEGLMTWAGRLHDYTGFKNTETELILGEQQQVIKDLYAELVHTSSTHAGWEVGDYPWTTRDFGNDLSPHGWFSADYVALVRNMLLREQGKDLHLLSALSPSWMKPGDTITVANAPTEFGRVAFRCSFSSSGMHLQLNTDFQQKPAHIIVHTPWFVTVTRATVDGKSIAVDQKALSIPASARQVDVYWTVPSRVPQLSYHSAVKTYKMELRHHYREFLRNGAPHRKSIKMY